MKYQIFTKKDLGHKNIYSFTLIPEKKSLQILHFDIPLNQNTYKKSFGKTMIIGGASNSSVINRIRANNEDGLAWTKNQLNKPMFIRIKKPLQKLKQFFLKPKL